MERQRTLTEARLLVTKREERREERRGERSDGDGRELSHGRGEEERQQAQNGDHLPVTSPLFNSLSCTLVHVASTCRIARRCGYERLIRLISRSHHSESCYRGARGTHRYRLALPPLPSTPPFTYSRPGGCPPRKFRDKRSYANIHSKVGKFFEHDNKAQIKWGGRHISGRTLQHIYQVNVQEQCACDVTIIRKRCDKSSVHTW